MILTDLNTDGSLMMAFIGENKGVKSTVIIFKSLSTEFYSEGITEIIRKKSYNFNYSDVHKRIKSLILKEK